MQAESPVKEGRWKGRVGVLLALSAAAVVLTWPVFFHGMWLAGQDTSHHLDLDGHFAAQFWGGDWYPHWIQEMNCGLGSAMYFIYPPFQSYVYALVLPIARALHLNAFGSVEYLCLFLSGVTAFLWARTLASKGVAAITAVIYMLLPYHLAVDFYRRGALPECWALAWMPLVLYFATRAVRGKRCAVPGLGAAMALLLSSHLISAAVFAAAPFLLVAALARRGERMRAFMKVAGGMALGAALSSAYLLPAFASMAHFHVARMPFMADGTLGANLFPLGRALPSVWSGGGFIRVLWISTVDTALFVAFCSVMALKEKPVERRNQVFLWLGMSVASLFLMSSASEWIWKLFPTALGAMQFPWRLNIVLCVAAIPLCAFLLTEVRGPAPHRRGVLAIMALFAVTWVVGFSLAIRGIGHASEAGVTQQAEFDDDWLAAWGPKGATTMSAAEAAEWSLAKFAAGQGAVHVVKWKPRHIMVETDCTACGPLVVKQFYYPEWKAWLSDGGAELPVTAVLPQGLLQVQVPPGSQRIELEIPELPAERWGNWASGLSALVCVGLFAMGLARRP